MTAYAMTFYRPDKTVLCRTENLGYAFAKAAKENLPDVTGTDAHGRAISGGKAYQNYKAIDDQRASLAKMSK